MSHHTDFDKVFVVNLNRRPDRWEHFLSSIPHDWPFAQPVRLAAIDGTKCLAPSWWRHGKGAWGCYRSHLNVIEHCLNNDIDSVLILEDDATFSGEFTRRAKSFLHHVPGDWEMLYFGGQHLHAQKHPPARINDWVYQPYNVNRTHAYAIRGPMLSTLYEYLHSKTWHTNDHIDHHLGRLHQLRQHRIYCPAEWIVGQNEGISDVCCRTTPKRDWASARRLAQFRPLESPFVAVIGLHCSGTACLAGVLHYLGVHLGNVLRGFRGKEPDPSCSFEAVGLAQICEDAISFPAAVFSQPPRQIHVAIEQWISDRQWEVVGKQKIAGGTHPYLCRLGGELRASCGERLRVVAITSSLDDSVNSLIRRTGGRYSHEQIRAHQQWLAEGKQQMLSSAEHLSIEYDELLANPVKQIKRVLDYLSLQPSEEGMVCAMRHVQGCVEACQRGE